MRIAFYAPLKSPFHDTPSGDRRVAGLYLEALTRGGHEVALASDLRSYNPDGNDAAWRALSQAAESVASRLIREAESGDPAGRPELWFTYHCYHKAPDWIGPRVSRALGIPYVIAEPSHAPKRARGVWSTGYEAAGTAIASADLLICPTRFDIACVSTLLSSPGKLVYLPPFLDVAPYGSVDDRAALRAALASKHQLDPSVPWMVVAAMMRPGDKQASYLSLARSLEKLADLGWHLLVAGDGPAQFEIRQALAAVAPGRTRFLGRLDQAALAQLFTAGDMYVWPGVNEAYGMALLEAQASGLPVVSVISRGIPDVVESGRTGLLAPPDAPQALADLVRRLILDGPLRARLGNAARRFANSARSIDAAAAILAGALARLPRS